MKTVDEVLRARAERLAARVDASAVADDREPILIVRVGQERFALPMRAVDRVLPLRGLSPVPLAPPTVRGVMAVRGEIHSVYHLDRVLNLPPAGPGEATQVVVLRGSVRAGVAVDAVEAIDFVAAFKTSAERRQFVTPELSPPLILLEDLSSLIARAAQGAS